MCGGGESCSRGRGNIAEVVCHLAPTRWSSLRDGIHSIPLLPDLVEQINKTPSNTSCYLLIVCIYIHWRVRDYKRVSKFIIENRNVQDPHLSSALMCARPYLSSAFMLFENSQCKYHLLESLCSPTWNTAIRCTTSCPWRSFDHYADIEHSCVLRQRKYKNLAWFAFITDKLLGPVQDSADYP